MSREADASKRWNWPMILVAGFVGLMLVWILIPPSGSITPRARQMKEVSKARQIILSMHVFAIDNDGQYPAEGRGYSGFHPITGEQRILRPGKSSTSHFAVLIPDYLPTERLFWSSSFKGEAPDENGELISSENHWGLVAGLNKESPGILPLVFEEAASLAAGPRWTEGREKKRLPGMAWHDWRVVIGFNDGSATLGRAYNDGVLLRGQNPFDLLGKEGAPAMDLRNP